MTILDVGNGFPYLCVRAYVAEMHTLKMCLSRASRAETSIEGP